MKCDLKVVGIVVALLVGFIWIVPEVRYQLFKPREFNEDPLYAIVLNDVRLLKKHLKRDPKIVYSREFGGSTLLHAATRGENLELVKCLLDVGTPVDIEDASGQTPLCGAVIVGRIDSAKLLMSAGADVNHRWNWPPPMKQGASVLEMAAFCGHYELVELLLKHGADVKSPDGTDSALHWACRKFVNPGEASYPANRGNRLVIDTLIKHHLSVNVQGAVQQTPLHVAAEVGNVDAVRYLLSAFPEIDVSAKNLFGKTAADLAAESHSSNSSDVIELFRQHSTKKDAQ